MIGVDAGRRGCVRRGSSSSRADEKGDVRKTPELGVAERLNDIGL